MPDITLTTTAQNATKLQTMVDFYNARNGTTLTLKQWIILMVREQYRSWNNERLSSLVAYNDDVTVT